MRRHHLAAVFALTALAIARDARAWVVVRAPVYVHPVPVVVVTPAPVYVPPPQPQPPPSSALTTKLPINATMWTLPPGCNVISVNGQTYYQCGVNWMKQYTTSTGSVYYGVVPPP